MDKRDAKPNKVNPERDLLHAILDIGHMSDDARLAWLLDFAQRDDIDDLTGAALLRAQAETFAFTVQPGALVVSRKQLSRRRIADLGAQIREGITRFFDGRGWRAQIRGNISRSVYLDPQTKQPRERLETATAPLVLWSAQNLIRDNADRIGNCKLCGRWFVIVKRQQFCSSACASKYRTAKWRSNPENIERMKEQRREAYRQKIAEQQKRDASKVKIQRRGSR